MSATAMQQVQELAAATRRAAGMTEFAWPGSFESGRACLSLALENAQNAAGWLEQVQRLCSGAASEWVECLALAAYEAEHAAEPQALMAVQAHLLERQSAMAARRLEDNLRYLFEAAANVSEQWLLQAGKMAAPWQRQADGAAAEARA